MGQYGWGGGVTEKGKSEAGCAGEGGGDGCGGLGGHRNELCSARACNGLTRSAGAEKGCHRHAGVVHGGWGEGRVEGGMSAHLAG